MDPGSKAGVTRGAGVTREESDGHRAGAAPPSDPDIAHEALASEDKLQLERLGAAADR